MSSLRRLDDRPLGDVNDLGRHTGRLRGVILGHALLGAIAGAVLMALSRICIAAHSPWDVVAGQAFVPVSTPA